MTFEQAVEFIFEKEGGYSNDPADTGGETKYGISKRAYPDLDIANLTKEAAAAIYRRDYWDRCRCGEFPNGLDLAVFDSAVNQGAVTAIKLLQRAVKVTDDGVLGPQTMQAAQKTPGVFEEFMARRMFQYAVIPQVHTFGLGWYRRLASVFKEAQ